MTKNVQYCNNDLFISAIIPHGALHLTTSSNGDLSVGGLLPPGTAPSLLQYPIQDGGPQQILVPSKYQFGMIFGWGDQGGLE